MPSVYIHDRPDPEPVQPHRKRDLLYLDKFRPGPGSTFADGLRGPSLDCVTRALLRASPAPSQIEFEHEVDHRLAREFARELLAPPRRVDSVKGRWFLP